MLMMKVYKIIDDVERVFIGVTNGNIHRHFIKFKKKHNNGCHFPIFDNGNCRIELIETCDNNEDNKLKYYIENTECINTDEIERMNKYLEETKQNYYKAYYLKNYETIQNRNLQNLEHQKEYSKKWRQEHKEIIKDKQKQYHIDNVEKLKEYRKIYYEKNNEK